MAGGQQITAAQGVLVARRTTPHLTISQGVLLAAGNDVTVGLNAPDLYITVEQGVVGTGQPLVGTESTSAAGTSVPGITVALGGIAATSQAGLLGTVLDADDTFMSTALGVLGPASEVVPTGAAATGQGGTLLVGGQEGTQALTTQLLLAQQYNIFGGITVALSGSGMTAGQGVVGTTGGVPATTRTRGGVGGWPNRRRKTLQEKLVERLEEVEEELLYQQPKVKSPIFTAPPPVDAIRELQAQIVNAVLQDQEQRSNDIPSPEEEEEIVEAAAHAMMLIMSRKRK